MKVSLVVAQGVHQGKVIPIPVAQFLIGREDGCQLRPSSPAISKKHCGILVKGGKVFVQDFGSTNGTFVNEEQVSGEQEVQNGDKIRVGPLEFMLKLERTPAPSRNQPKPSALTPAPKDSDVPTKEEKPVSTRPKSEEPDADQIAAMLLGTDDGPTHGGPVTADQIPDGSTVFDMSAVTDPNAKKPEEKKPPAAEVDNSKRAADILRKYMQRPRSQ
jgi:pSer/pThr/pTyr-binding forkhead associated (FHA) protein